MNKYDRDGLVTPPSDFEKITILPVQGETDPCIFAFTDGRFAIDIMSEHSLFFVVGMPPELITTEREEAQKFQAEFTDLLAKIDASGPPKPNELTSFCNSLIEAIAPFNEYKQRMAVLQDSGKLRSAVWSSYMRHMSQEAVYWMNRLKQVAKGDVAYSMPEAQLFGTDIIADHAQYTAHLLDPSETVLIYDSFNSAELFSKLKGECTLAAETDQACDTATVIVDAKKALISITQLGRGIEGGTVKSIIDPILADHVRRETLKITDELGRTLS